MFVVLYEHAPLLLLGIFCFGIGSYLMARFSLSETKRYIQDPRLDDNESLRLAQLTLVQAQGRFEFSVNVIVLIAVLQFLSIFTLLLLFMGWLLFSLSEHAIKAELVVDEGRHFSLTEKGKWALVALAVILLLELPWLVPITARHLGLYYLLYKAYQHVEQSIEWIKLMTNLSRQRLREELR